MYKWLLVAAAAFTLGGTAESQQPSIPHAGETIEVSIVNVDVFVTDKKGNRVGGLTKDDFQIFDDGVRQPITNFAEYRQEPSASVQLAEAPGSPTATLPPTAEAPKQKRTIIVFIERFRLPPVLGDPFFAAIRKMLHDSVRPGDAAMVVTWDRGLLQTRQPFTDDLGALDRTVDVIAKQTAGVMREDVDMAKAEADDLKDFESEGMTSGGGAGGADFAMNSAMWAHARMAVADQKRKVSTVNALMRSVAAIDGKKVMLLATHRLSLMAGAEFFYAAGRRDVPIEFRSELDNTQLLRSLEQTANANGFTIYPIYPEGLAKSSLPTSADRAPTSNPDIEYLTLNNETPALEEIAHETGGSTAWGSVDAANLLPKLRDDLSSYYSLAYRASPKKGERPHTIVVKTKDPNLVVRSRREFIPKSDVTRMEDRVIGSLFGLAEGARFKFGLQFGPRKHQGKNFVIPVSVQIPIAALTPLQEARDYSGAFSVYVAHGQAIGGVSTATHETKPFHIPAADLQKAKQSYFTYQFDLITDGGEGRVAIGVQDETSKEYALRVVELHPPAQK